MIKIILIIHFGIMALLGLTEMFHAVKLIFISPDESAQSYSVIVLTAGCAAEQLRYAYEQRLWLGSAYADDIIAVVSNLDNDEISECTSFAEDRGIILCKDDLNEQIMGNGTVI